MANTNKVLNKAGVAKKDEFYTQLTDIEKEMRYYREYFKDKTVLCNCDDPFESNFFKYFAMNFNPLGLKKLIATCYSTSPIIYTQLSLFDEGEVIAVDYQGKKPYKVIITKVEDENGDGRVDLSDVEYLLKNKKNVLTLLEGDGDFRSEECIELLKQADVVVTNPPFSLFREYVAQLMEYEKDFIIIGNQNAITYKEIFPLFMGNKIWYGASIHSHGRDFRVPDDYPLQAYEFRTDENGIKYINVKGVKASIVITSANNKYAISSRSIDELNVQMLMEKLGGGGHRSSAGATIEAESYEDCVNKIKAAIDEVLNEEEGE